MCCCGFYVRVTEKRTYYVRTNNSLPIRHSYQLVTSVTGSDWHLQWRNKLNVSKTEPIHTKIENKWIGSQTLKLLPLHFNTDSDLEPVFKLGVKVREVEDLRILGTWSRHNLLLHCCVCGRGECRIVDGVVVHLPVLWHHWFPGKSDATGIQHLLHQHTNNNSCKATTESCTFNYGRVEHGNMKLCR